MYLYSNELKFPSFPTFSIIQFGNKKDSQKRYTFSIKLLISHMSNYEKTELQESRGGIIKDYLER